MIDGASLEPAGPGLHEYVQVVRRRKLVAISVLAAALAAAAAFSFLQKPTYRATTKLVVGQGNALFEPGEAGAVQPFTATMGDLVKSTVVANNVIENLGLEESPESVLGRTSVSINPETAVLKVSVEDHDRQRAVAIAQNIGLVFEQLVKERFGEAQQGGAAAAQPPLTARVFDPARAKPDPVSPKPVRNLALAGVLGLLLGLMAAFVRERFDRMVRTRERVEESLGAPVIGQIPFEKAHKREPRRLVATSGGTAEAFRALRANLQFLAVKRPLQTILVTSATAGEGKTTVTANLALATALSGARTVALDADLRRPKLNEAFQLPSGGPGLTNVLVGAAELEAALVEAPPPAFDGASASIPEHLALVRSGPLPPNPSELLSSFQMRDVLEELRMSYDYVLIDSPPLLAVADALELARVVDGVVVVARRNHVTTGQAEELRELVERLDIHVVGAVFTDAPGSATYGYGSYGRSREDEREAEHREAELVSREATTAS